jgi:hypothetical protein
MPTYPDLPTFAVYPAPEMAIRGVIDSTVGTERIKSVLDVGSGHGGVFDYAYLSSDGRHVTSMQSGKWIRPGRPRTAST